MWSSYLVRWELGRLYTQFQIFTRLQIKNSYSSRPGVYSISKKISSPASIDFSESCNKNCDLTSITFFNSHIAIVSIFTYQHLHYRYLTSHQSSKSLFDRTSRLPMPLVEVRPLLYLSVIRFFARPLFKACVYLRNYGYQNSKLLLMWNFVSLLALFKIWDKAHWTFFSNTSLILIKIRLVANSGILHFKSQLEWSSVVYFSWPNAHARDRLHETDWFKKTTSIILKLSNITWNREVAYSFA